MPQLSAACHGSRAPMRWVRRSRALAAELPPCGIAQKSASPLGGLGRWRDVIYYAWSTITRGTRRWREGTMENPVDENKISTELAQRAIDRILLAGEKLLREYWARYRNRDISSYSELDFPHFS